MAQPRVFELVCPDPQGTVYELLQDDFDCAQIESLSTGVPHISVTLDPKGQYPSFTVPLSQVREIPFARQEEQAA
jgi:hypothetical protein